MAYWHDFSGRLSFDFPDIKAADYSELCRNMAVAFDLCSVRELIIGPEQMFWDFRRGQQIIGLDWDIWLGFQVVAKTAGSEPLLRDIVDWLKSTGKIQVQGTEPEPKGT